jgi:hypothetical protein
MDEVSIIGLDLAKNVFQAHGPEADGSVLFRLKLARAQQLKFLSEQPPCIVAMEACASAHHWGHAISDLGHEVRLIPPAYVKPFVKRQKNDMADAEAIAEAASRPTMYYPAGDACIAERAVRGREERGTAGSGDGVSHPRSLGSATHADDQRPSGPFGRARDRRARRSCPCRPPRYGRQWR